MSPPRSSTRGAHRARAAATAALSVAVAALAASAASRAEEEAATDPHREVRGVTISTQTWGREWADPGLDAELAELQALGVNWIAIHPYGWVRDDGTVAQRPAIDPDDPPDWITRPIAAAHARGMAVLVKPHLGYWGSGFAWRGEIEFAAEEERARFFADHRAWLLAVARAARGADAFCVGTELDRLVGFEAEWRSLIAEVRAAFDGHLTYAANWTDVERVPFWDALDVVGVQGYFPLSDADVPTDADLRAGWDDVVARLRALHERTGKPVVLCELGYNRSLAAAREPWSHAVAPEPDRARAEALQVRCLDVALATLARERDWLRGAFLWKWFVGEPRSRDFALQAPAVRAVVGAAWRGR